MSTDYSSAPFLGKMSLLLYATVCDRAIGHYGPSPDTGKEYVTQVDRLSTNCPQSKALVQRKLKIG